MNRAALIYTACAVMSLALVTACEEKKPAPTAASSEPAPKKPKAAMGAPCQKNEDCGDGLGCADDKTCQTYKTIECRGRDDACKKDGRCSGSPEGKCVAATNKDCESAAVCQEKGRCAAKKGKCVATSEEDCKAVCKKLGFCTLQDDRCLAATNDDCKQSEQCTRFKKCVARQGQCFKKRKSLSDEF